MTYCKDLTNTWIQKKPIIGVMGGASCNKEEYTIAKAELTLNMINPRF